MDKNNLKLCRLCLKILEEGNFKIIENITKDMLDVLLLKINFLATNDTLICTTCFNTLKKLFYFKSTCLDVEESLNQYIGAKKVLRVDLKAVYKNIKANGKVTYPNLHHKVCRFCLNFYKSTAVSDIQGDGCLMEILRKYYPELDLTTTDAISACENCLDCLILQFNFTTNCLDTEKNISAYRRTVIKNNKVLVDLGSVLEFSSTNNGTASDITSKNSTDYRVNGDEVKEENSMQIREGNEDVTLLSVDIANVKEEECEIKAESDDDLSLEMEHTLDISTQKAPKKQTRVRRNTKPRQEKPIHRCAHCPFTTNKRGAFNRHSIKHKDPSQLNMFKCTLCPFQSKYKDSNHMLMHDPEPTMYKCDTCPFQSRHRHSTLRHGLTHKDFSQINSFKCDQCTFEARHKCGLKTHMLSHQSGSQLELYKCGLCPYETKLRGNLPKHMLKHKRPGETTMYICDTCGFETKHRISLETHLIVHKSVTEVAMFKCNSCSFSARHKGNLKKHMLVHRTSSEVTMYKCDACPFQTKHKISLKTHTLRHKTPVELTLFRCEFCSFTAKHKGNLKAHVLTHKDAPDTVMYQCEKCKFKTKHKTSLKTHLLMHRRRSDVQMHRCGECPFETLHKGNLKKHMVVHMKPSEVVMYECDVCEFHTKHKDSLKAHTSMHSEYK